MDKWPWEYKSEKYARAAKLRDDLDAALARRYPGYVVVGQDAGRRGAMVQHGNRRAIEALSITNRAYVPE